MENLLSFIDENLYVLVPAIFIIGMALKKTEKIKDNYIPLILIGVGVILVFLIQGVSGRGVVDGIMCAGTAVLGNQVWKQVYEKGLLGADTNE